MSQNRTAHFVRELEMVSSRAGYVTAHATAEASPHREEGRGGEGLYQRYGPPPPPPLFTHEQPLPDIH